MVGVVCSWDIYSGFYFLFVLLGNEVCCGKFFSIEILLEINFVLGGKGYCWDWFLSYIVVYSKCKFGSLFFLFFVVVLNF